MNEADWEAAGLFDPSAPDAADRLELLRYLDSIGVTLDEMLEAAERRSLGSAAPDHLLQVGGDLTVAEAAVRAGLDPDAARRVLLAAGIALPAGDEGRLSDDDVAVLQAFAAAAGLLGLEPTVAFTRVIAGSLARIVEAADAMFLSVVEGPLVAGGGRPVDVARSSHDGVAMLLGVPELMRLLFRRHVRAAISRSRAARPGLSVDRFRLAVGFADLVGFTQLASRLDGAALGAAIADFEREAAEHADAGGARLVKSMGDAVMIVGPDPVALVEMLAGLAAAVHDHPVLTDVRAAVAAGDLLARDGDYFGPDVNVAARAVAEAEPGEVVVTAVVAGLLPAAEPIGARALKGIDAPVPLFRAGSPAAPDG